MNEFLKALEVATQELTKENLAVAVKKAAEVVAADRSRYKLRGRWRSTADQMCRIWDQMAEETLLEECVLHNLKSLARYYSARKKRYVLVEPGLWSLGYDPNVVRIRHNHGRWAVLVARDTVRGELAWETYKVSNASQAHRLACFHLG